MPDGLLSSESEVDQAKPLGIRPFTVANVLDRLVGATDHEAEPGELASFLWRLLTRETASEFSVQSAWERAQGVLSLRMVLVSDAAHGRRP